MNNVKKISNILRYVRRLNFCGQILNTYSQGEYLKRSFQSRYYFIRERAVYTGIYTI